jgi:hypothetical protein
MAVLRERWQSWAMIGLLASIVTVAPAACTASSPPGQSTEPVDAATATTEPRQFRNPMSFHVVVRIDQTACLDGSNGVPGPGAGGDWCYFLDPGFTVTQAEQVHLVRDPQTDGFVVSVTLQREDRDEFAAWTTGAAGRQIAISIQGRVVQAPQLLTPLTDGSFQIGGLTESEARTLLRQLSG